MSHYQSWEDFFERLTGRTAFDRDRLRGPDDWEALAGQLAREGNLEGAAYAHGVSNTMRTYEKAWSNLPPKGGEDG